MVQYALPSSAPTFALEPPTLKPVGSFEQQQYQPPSPRSLPMSIPSSANSSRQGTPASSLSSSYRHHPYSASLDSHRPRPSRSRSATSASDTSDWSEEPSTGGEGDEMELDFGAEQQLQDPSLALLDFSLDLERLPPLPTLPSSTAPSADTSRAPSPTSGGSKAKAPKGKTSHARKTPPGHIKRPPNAFIIFRSHCCAPDQVSTDGIIPPGTPTAQQLSELGIIDHRHISRIVSHLWKSLKPAEKAYWEQKAQQKKDEHAAAHPDYRYKPVYRNKDEVRRRRKHGRDDTEEEKKACEKLASELLGIDVTAASEQKVVAKETAKKNRKSRAKQVPVRDPTDHDRTRWTIGTVASAPKTDHFPLPTPPPHPVVEPKKRSRRKVAAPPLTSSYSYDQQEQFGDIYTQPPHPQHFDPHYIFDRPHTAPDPYPGQAEGDFAKAYYPARRESHTRTRSNTQGHDESYQFGYMVQLDEIMALQGNQQHIVDPRQLDSVPSSRPHTASYADLPTLSPQEHMERVSSSRKGPPAPLELPYNPTFVPYPSAADFIPQEAQPASQYGRPPSPRSLAINEMQHYHLPSSTATSVSPTPRAPSPQSSSSAASSHPSSHHSHLSADPNPLIISPTSRTFSFANVGLGLPPTVPLRRDSEFGPSSAAHMGMKRRGTLRATGATGGDLMLISPVSGTFGGRKFSLGRWELPKRSISGESGGAGAATTAATGQASGLSTKLWQTFELDPSFIEFLETQPVAPFGDIAAQLDALKRDEGVTPFDEDDRPGTATSSYSDRPGTATSEISHEGSPVLRELDPRAGEGFWRSSSSIEKHQSQYSLQPPAPQEPYHVGQDSFFVPPADPLQAHPDYHPSSAHTTHSPPQPAFGSSAFGGSFQPAAHKQSLDAQLAAAAAEEKHYRQQQQQFTASVFDQSPHLAQDDWMARRDRGSDATLRGRQDSIRDLTMRHEEALKVLQSQLADPESQLMEQAQEGVPEGVDPHLKYCYLTPEQAKDARLVEHIFR